MRRLILFSEISGSVQLKLNCGQAARTMCMGKYCYDYHIGGTLEVVLVRVCFGTHLYGLLILYVEHCPQIMQS